jgi:hypothetical protein
MQGQEPFSLVQISMQHLTQRWRAAHPQEARTSTLHSSIAIFPSCFYALPSIECFSNKIWLLEAEVCWEWWIRQRRRADHPQDMDASQHHCHLSIFLLCVVSDRMLQQWNLTLGGRTWLRAPWGCGRGTQMTQRAIRYTTWRALPGRRKSTARRRRLQHHPALRLVGSTMHPPARRSSDLVLTQQIS